MWGESEHAPGAKYSFMTSSLWPATSRRRGTCPARTGCASRLGRTISYATRARSFVAEGLARIGEDHELHLLPQPTRGAAFQCERAVAARSARGAGGENRRRAAEQRDELAPLHSITSSAVASSDGGTSRPSAFAVLRLMTSSYLVGACTGRSAAFSPLKIRSTYSAAR